MEFNHLWYACLTYIHIAHTHTYTHMHTRTHAHTYTHTHTHTHTHKHTHTKLKHIYMKHMHTHTKHEYVYTHTHTHIHTHTHKTYTSHIPCIHGHWINKHNCTWQTRGQAKYCEYIKTWIVIIKVDVNITLTHHNIINKQHLPSCCQNQINLAITLLKLRTTGTLTSHPVSSKLIPETESLLLISLQAIKPQLGTCLL